MITSPPPSLSRKEFKSLGWMCISKGLSHERFNLSTQGIPKPNQ